MANVYSNLELIQKDIDDKVKPENIRKGVEVFGVVGSLEPPTIDTSDGDVTPNDIIRGKTAYAKGEKVQGELNSVSGEYTNNNITGFTKFTKQNGDSIEEYNQYVEGCDEAHIFEDLNGTIFNNSTYNINLTESGIAQSINLNANQILTGNTMLGVTGTALSGDTTDYSDSTISSSLEEGKTVYYKGKKIEGTLKQVYKADEVYDLREVPNCELRGSGSGIHGTDKPEPNEVTGEMYMSLETSKFLFQKNSHMIGRIPADENRFIPETIKKGVTIFGVEGKLERVTEKHGEEEVVLGYKYSKHSPITVNPLIEKWNCTQFYKEHFIYKNDIPVYSFTFSNFNIWNASASTWDNLKTEVQNWYYTSYVIYLGTTAPDTARPIFTIKFKDRAGNIIFTIDYDTYSTFAQYGDSKVLDLYFASSDDKFNFDTFCKIYDYDIIFREVS